MEEKNYTAPEAEVIEFKGKDYLFGTGTTGSANYLEDDSFEW